MPDTFVPAPTGGVSRFGSLNRQPQGTLVESVNFWPQDAPTGRRVLATRPPLVSFTSPGSNINLFAPISGDATQTPQRTIITAADGTLYYWDGADWASVSGGSITTGRQVFAASYLKRAVIFNDTTPLVFNYDDLSLGTFTASEGTVPGDCRFGVAWRGGIWIAGALSQPQVVSGSRTGDIFDWDFSETDTAAAFQFAGEDSGLIGEPVTALIPASSDVMLVAWVDGMSMLRGHPRRGGILEPVSSKIGVMGQGAWTQGPDYRVYFMSREGLATIAPEGGAPSLISRKALPSELIGLPYDYTSPNINLEYDVRFNGIHITVGGGNPQAWFYDLEEGGFHQMTLPEYPTTTVRFDTLETEAASGVLFGGATDIKRFNTLGSEDISSQAIIGPLPLAKTAMRNTRVKSAMLHFLDGTTAEPTSAVVMRVGADGDDAYARYQNNSLGNAYQTDMQSLVAQSGRVNPQLVGNSLLLELYASGVNHRIVFDGMSVEGEPVNRNRLVTRDSLSDDPTDEQVTIGLAWTLGGVYAAASATGPSFTTSSMPLLIDLSDMPAGWWAKVKGDGGDVRVTTNNNALLPMDLLAFDYDNQTGLVAVRKSLTASAAVSLRVWCGNASATEFPEAGRFGRFNVYPSTMAAFWPTGAGTDRTRNRLNLTPQGGLVDGSGSSLLGGLASTRYESATNGFGADINFDDGTSSGDPGPGNVRLNNATAESATTLYISNVDANGNSIDAELSQFASDGVSIMLTNTTTEEWILANVNTVTDNTTHYTVTFTGSAITSEQSASPPSPPSGSISFSDGDALRVSLGSAGQTDVYKRATVAPSIDIDLSEATVMSSISRRYFNRPYYSPSALEGSVLFKAANEGETDLFQVALISPGSNNGADFFDTHTESVAFLYEDGANDSVSLFPSTYANGTFYNDWYNEAWSVSSGGLVRYRNGVSVSAGTALLDYGPVDDVELITIGQDTNLDGSSANYAVDQTLVSLWAEQLSAAFVAYYDGVVDTSSYWGTWTLSE
jgi:hypothetical protein